MIVLQKKVLFIILPVIALCALPLAGLASGNGGIAMGVLQNPAHSTQLNQVTGLIRGMTEKLQNLSTQLDTHQAHVEARIAALQATGHTINVATELSAFQSAVTTAKTSIQSVITALQQLPESSAPSQQVTRIQGLVQDLKTKLTAVRTSFDTLKKAVTTQLQTESSSSNPSSSPTL